MSGLVSSRRSGEGEGEVEVGFGFGIIVEVGFGFGVTVAVEVEVRVGTVALVATATSVSVAPGADSSGHVPPEHGSLGHGFDVTLSARTPWSGGSERSSGASSA